jgi:hypothetical protein
VGCFCFFSIFSFSFSFSFFLSFFFLFGQYFYELGRCLSMRTCGFHFNAIEVLDLCIYKKSHWMLLVQFCHWICTSVSIDSIVKVLPCTSIHKITFPLSLSTLKYYIQHARIHKPTMIWSNNST